MKITFVSNYLSHHQTAFSDYMYRHLGTEYSFIATVQMNAERRALGYDNFNSEPYLSLSYSSQTSLNNCKDIVDQSDVIIIGSAPDEWMIHRLKQKKLTFKYSERFYKQKITVRDYIIKGLAAWLHHGRFQKYPIYMLCASAYTAADCAKFRNYLGRTYKWGYFPEVKEYDAIDSLVDNKKANSIVWVARFIDWKHPEIPVKIAQRLKEDGYDFEMSMIGNGTLENDIKELVDTNNLCDHVKLLGSMKPNEVREYMEKSQIFLFTSDFNEGWGAVLNEAMNSGCACIASHAIGSVPFLLNHRENGIIYENGNIDDLYNNVKFLLDNPKKQREYGIKAYTTIKETWNAEVASKRFLKLVEEIEKNGKCESFSEGPCSRAEILKNDWFKAADFEIK